jgi:hypothetical protein
MYTIAYLCRPDMGMPFCFGPLFRDAPGHAHAGLKLLCVDIEHINHCWLRHLREQNPEQNYLLGNETPSVARQAAQTYPGRLGAPDACVPHCFQRRKRMGNHIEA